MPRRNDEAIREQLARLRDAHQHTSDRLAERLTEDLTQLHRDNSDLRHDLNKTLSGGLAELCNDNAQLRDQIVETVREGFGRVHAENLELRTRLDRAVEHLAQAREMILAMRAEARVPMPTAEADDGSGGERPTATSNSEQNDNYPAILRQAAGIAYARLECHRDTWDFLVAQSAQYEHFRLPSDVEDDENGLVDVDISGRTLIAILDALWHTRNAVETPDGTKALAWQVYERIARAIATVQGGSQPAATEPATEQSAQDAFEATTRSAVERSEHLLAPESSNPDPTPIRRRVVHIVIDDRP